jgi:hypothetical protein
VAFMGFAGVVGLLVKLAITRPPMSEAPYRVPTKTPSFTSQPRSEPMRTSTPDYRR